MEVDTDRLHRVLAEEKLTDCIRPKIRKEWEKLRSHNTVDRVTLDASQVFFSRPCCTKREKPNKNMLGSSKKNPYARKCCIVVKQLLLLRHFSNNAKFKDLNRRKLQQRGVIPLENCRKILDDSVKVTSTRKRFSYKKICCCYM